MARLNTKTMTPAELKATKKELGSSLKALEGSIKLGEKTVAEAAKTRDAAIGEVNKRIAALNKELATVTKTAGKTYDAVVAKVAKERKKLDVQVSAHKEKLTQVEQALTAAQEGAAA